MGIVSDVILALTFPISSPRIGSCLIRKIGGYDQGIATSLLNASPSVRNAIHNAVNKENMTFNDAVELYAKDYLKKGVVSPKTLAVGAGATGLAVGAEQLNQKLAEDNKTTYKAPEDPEVDTEAIRQGIVNAENRTATSTGEDLY